MSKKISLISLAVAAVIGSSPVFSASHRESPFITSMPKVDSTDFYMFRSYESGRENYVTLIANYQPLQDPNGGPNYFSMEDNAVYEIHIDNDGDAIEDITFQFDFSNALANNGEGQSLTIGAESVAVPLKHIGGISAGDNSALGFNETYSVNIISGDRRTGSASAITNSTDASATFTKPYDNTGNKTFADYSAYANQYVYGIDIPNCNANDAKMFVGQRKESFAVNLGEIFDLVNFVPIDNSAGLSAGIDQDTANNDLVGKNITTVAIEVPISCLVNSNDTIAAWTSASVPQAKIYNPVATFEKPTVNGGALVQVSRLGNPLVNEVVIGVKDKNKFGSSEPKDDGANFATYVTNPTLPAILNLLFKDAVNGLTGQSYTDIAPTNFPRADLVAAFLTGFTGVNADGSVAEMVRLNTSIAATSAGSQNSLGVVAGDLAGFPNGRRPGDDVVDVALRAMMGALCHPIAVDLDSSGTAGDVGDNLGLCAPSDAVVGTVPFTDGAPISDADFDSAFPYLTTPLAGSPN